MKPLPELPGKNKPLPTPPRQFKALPPVPGGLLSEITRCHEAGIAVGIVLIDEGETEREYDETAAQRRVLALAAELGLKVLAVEIDTELAKGGETLGNNTRGEFLEKAHAVVKKPLFNAFDDNAKPPMQATLGSLGLNPGACRLVIMGYNTNQCVRLTAVGGENKPGQLPLHRGATQRGYEVLTCQAVLRGGAASWAKAPHVHFFAHV